MQQFLLLYNFNARYKKNDEKGGFFMKKLVVKAVVSLSVLLFTIGVGTTVAQATIARPHPTYYDTWNYGRSGNHGWSYYYLQAPVRLGSSSAVKNMFGRVKARSAANYGWARADATKAWNDVRLDAFYGWYAF